MCLHSNVLLNRYKKDLSTSSTVFGDFRKRFSSNFTHVDIKEEKTNDVDILKGGVGLTVEEASQNVIPLRKHRTRSSGPLTEDSDYDGFANTDLELNAEEVEDLINWSNKPPEER